MESGEIRPSGRASVGHARRFSLQIAGFYAVAGVLWILFSDELVALLFQDPALLTRAQTFKGWAYVLVTALILYRLILTYVSRIEAVIEAREAFMSVSSHELRTPVTTLKLQLEMAKRLWKSGEGLSEEQAALLFAVTGRQVARLQRLIDDILDLGTIERGSYVQKEESVDLSRLLSDVAMELRPEAARLGSELQIQIEPGVSIRGDAGRLEQLITNLVLNAAKFGANQPVSVRLSRERLDSTERARLDIEDHGIGIPKEALERIFSPFERAVSARYFGGLGLGLFISKNIVEAHGGTIEVESESGRGSHFTVRLPESAAS